MAKENISRQTHFAHFLYCLLEQYGLPRLGDLGRIKDTIGLVSDISSRSLGLPRHQVKREVEHFILHTLPHSYSHYISNALHHPPGHSSGIQIHFPVVEGSQRKMLMHIAAGFLIVTFVNSEWSIYSVHDETIFVNNEDLFTKAKHKINFDSTRKYKHVVEQLSKEVEFHTEVFA